MTLSLITFADALRLGNSQFISNLFDLSVSNTYRVVISGSTFFLQTGLFCLTRWIQGASLLLSMSSSD